MEDSQSAGGRTRRRGNTGKWITLIFGLAFVGSIVVSWIGSSQDSHASHASSTAPSYLREMELIGEVTGKEALAEINKLHGKDIDVVDGYMAEYGHNRNRAMVWVARASNQEAASSLLKGMVERIEGGTGKQPFRNLRSVSVGGKQVFAVDGPGGDNFFYASDNKVVWLALQLQGGDSIGVVKTALKVF